jgi:hypothetical protein
MPMPHRAPVTITWRATDRRFCACAERQRQLFNCTPIAGYVTRSPSPSPEGKWSGAPTGPGGGLSSPADLTVQEVFVNRSGL